MQSLAWLWQQRKVQDVIRVHHIETIYIYQMYFTFWPLVVEFCFGPKCWKVLTGQNCHLWQRNKQLQGNFSLLSVFLVISDMTLQVNRFYIISFIQLLVSQLLLSSVGQEFSVSLPACLDTVGCSSFTPSLSPVGGSTAKRHLSFVSRNNGTVI